MYACKISNIVLTFLQLQCNFQNFNLQIVAAFVSIANSLVHVTLIFILLICNYLYDFQYIINYTVF